MWTSKLSKPDRDKPPQPRSGHGTASVIARLNEQLSRVEPSAMDEPEDEESAAREEPAADQPAANDSGPRPA